MNELITIVDGATILDINVANQIAEFERKAKEIEEAEKALREQIQKEMEEKGIKSVSTDSLLISYKQEYDRENFDKKRFRADHPDLYDSYISMTTVNASVSIKLKESK